MTIETPVPADTSDILCAFSDCKNPVFAFITWGNYPNGDHNKANVCEQHCNEVYEACKTAIQTLVCHWSMEKPHTEL